MLHSIRAIPAFSDNYIWLLDNGAGEAAVVDPGDAAPVQQVLEETGLTLSAILLTHHHFDHVGGVQTLCEQFHCPVYGPESLNLESLSHPLCDGARITLFGCHFGVLCIPGHTLDHIAYFSTDALASPVLFCGDTLFAGGCGRVFEGTFAMMHASLQRLDSLPADTQVYCAHEYTAANLRFAQAVEPQNTAVGTRIAEVETLRANNTPTLPSSLAVERATNPFLRCTEASVAAAVEAAEQTSVQTAEACFAGLRRWKDRF